MAEKSITPQPVKTLPTFKRLLGLVAVLGVMLTFPVLGFFFDKGGAVSATGPIQLPTVIMMVISAALALLGGAWWGLVIITCAFTFNFQQPFFARYRMKGWFCKLIAEGLFEFSFAFLCAPSILVMISRLTSSETVIPFALMSPLLIGLIGFSWLQLMAPVERKLIGRRLNALGITAGQFRAGWPMGVSDPDKNSFKKFPLVEEDMGMLWISPTHLSFRGDVTCWDLTREDLLDVERKADAGGVSAYFGAVHVILHARNPDGSRRRIRFHPEGNWTATQMTKDLERLAARIHLWRQNISEQPAGISYQGLGAPS